MVEALAERAVVLIEIVTGMTAPPGVTVADGLKLTLVPAGSPETLNITGYENGPPTGERVRRIFAVCPAVIDETEAGGVNEKSVTATWIGCVVPPVDNGFITVMISAPAWLRSLGSSVACSSVELTKVVTRGLPFTRT